MKQLIIVLIVVMLAGCAAPLHDARVDVNDSKNQYKHCLQSHPNDLAECDQLRQLYEIDRQAIEAMAIVPTNRN